MKKTLRYSYSLFQMFENIFYEKYMIILIMKDIKYKKKCYDTVNANLF